MLTIYQLMKYLRNHHSIKVKANQAQALRNIGYYHGFKGYRFIRNPSQRIPFTSLDEVIALNTFDMLLSRKLNDALSSRLFYAHFDSHRDISHFKSSCFCELFF